VTTQSLDAGAVLYFKGDRADKVFRLLRGSIVEEFREGENNFTMPVRPGECFGVTEVFGNSTRLGSARAETLGQIETYSPEQFFSLLQTKPDLLETVLVREIALLNKLNELSKHQVGHSDDEVVSQEATFYRMGDFYAKSERPKMALYIYRRYTEIYPEGEYLAEAREQIEEMTGAVAAAEEDTLTPKELLARGAEQENKADFVAAVETYKRLVMMDFL